MKTIISDFSDKIKIITPDDEFNYFFAYYDMRATGKNGINPKHLCHRVKFMDRLPERDDVCELGYIDNGKFIKFAETTAWNFQQGAMLQYHPTLPDTVYYNVEENGEFKTVTHNTKSGEKSCTDMATACISPDGRYGLAVNFGRIFAFRPGYGYAGFIDKGEDVTAPHDDGVFLTDMKSGKSKLLISYRDMLSESGFSKNQKILVNHITFNTDSTRYVMLTRNFIGEDGVWKTSMMIGDLSGNVKTVLKKTYVSHYWWCSEREILAHCSAEGERKKSLYIINVDTGEYREIKSYYFNLPQGDIHCSVTPDGKYVIGDGYPIDGYRHLLAINLKTGESRVILKAKTDIPKIVDIRCDLHARYVFDGKYVSFDTTHNGKRQIAIFSLDNLNF